MGNLIKIPSDCEREKKRTVQHPCYNIHPWLTSETFVLPSYVCLTAIYDRHWYWNIECQQWTLKNYMDIYIYFQWWCWSSILQVLFQKADNIVQLLILNMVEFLQIETVTDLCPRLSHGCSRVPDIIYCSRVPDTRHYSRTQTLFQSSDTVPELRYCSRLVDARYWAKILGLLLLLLLQRSLPQSVAIVYCTRSSKFFSLYWCNTNWHFLVWYNSFSF